MKPGAHPTVGKEGPGGECKLSLKHSFVAPYFAKFPLFCDRVEVSRFSLCSPEAQDEGEWDLCVGGPSVNVRVKKS